MTYRTPADMNYRKVEFAYNQDGLRVESKTTVIDGGEEQVETRRYTLHGKNIVHLHCSFNEYEMYQMHFFYDAQGRASIVEYNEGYSTAKYAYIHNLQGDVIGLVDENGNEVVRYTYDAWGKLLNTTGELAYTLGFYNPFRYRGYVYDEETGLYYLRSRYYNSDKGRFLNADSVLAYGIKINSHNAYSYCRNLPVMNSDSNGHWPTYFAPINNLIYKPFYSGAAFAFLKSKQWNITNSLFQHAIWGKGENYPSNEKDAIMLRQAIANNQQTKSFLADMAKDMPANTSKNISEDFEYTQGDLHYALQHVRYSGTIYKDLNGKGSAEIELSDTFDFTQERLDWSSFKGLVDSISLSTVANDAGLGFQHLRIITKFDICIDVNVSQ